MSATDNDFFDPTKPAPKVETPEATKISRLLREAGWILFLALSAYLVLIFVTYSGKDAGYFFSGTGAPIANKGGTSGAWLSDFLLGLFGLSAWWWVVLAGYGVTRLFGRVETSRLFHRRNIIIALVGFVMGAADLVPGVSGGTVAFVCGIYDRLINGIKSFDLTTLRLLLGGRFKEVFDRVPVPFFVALGLGLMTAIFSLSHALSGLFATHPVQLWSFFFGLVFHFIRIFCIHHVVIFCFRFRFAFLGFIRK
jgi:hypothetical protein